MDEVLKVRNLDFSYGKNKSILESVNFDVKEGEVIGLVGMNGSGKSTLMKILLNLFTHQEGSIYFLNEEITKGAYLKRVGALVESPKFLGDLTGWENLKYLSYMNPSIEKEWVEYLSEELELTTSLNQKFKKYSLGMKQKLGVIYALSNKPKFVILDEPFNGLDWNSVGTLKKLIKQLRTDFKTAFLISSHILEELNILCDQIYLVRDKKVLHLNQHNKMSKLLIKVSNKSEYKSLSENKTINRLIIDSDEDRNEVILDYHDDFSLKKLYDTFFELNVYPCKINILKKQLTNILEESRN